MLSHFDAIPERDRQMDGQMDRIAIYQEILNSAKKNCKLYGIKYSNHNT